MKRKIIGILQKQVSMEDAITACMVTFLCTVATVVLWLMFLSGGWGNLVSTLKFSQILGVIDRVYIGQADAQQAAETAFDTMISGLGDRWSYYMTNEEYRQYQQNQSNTYTGVGLTIQQEEQGLKIVAVATDSPAAKAGMKADTWLVEVNGVRLTDESVAEVSAMLREQPENVRMVTVDADGIEESFTMALEVIYSNPVSFEMKDGFIGYIRMENFDETCAAEAIKAVDALVEQGATALVFDVRNNGGGYVTELCKLLDYLLPEGEIFVSVDYKGKETVTKSDKNCVDLPMAVLVNENSFSAAEFFAAALREFDVATVVGAQTTGKNRSQTNVILVDGSAVHISSRQYLTPNRVDLTQQGGLTPDVEVADGENDPQLSAALEVFHETTAEFG